MQYIQCTYVSIDFLIYNFILSIIIKLWPFCHFIFKYLFQVSFSSFSYVQNISYVLFFFLASTTYFSHSHTVNATFCIFRHFETALLSFFLFTYEELCFNTRTKIEWYLILYFHPFILLYFCLTFFRLPFSWRVTTAEFSCLIFPPFFFDIFSGARRYIASSMLFFVGAKCKPRNGINGKCVK